MGVGPGDQRDAAVQEMAEGCLLARRLAVHVDQNGVGLPFQPMGCQRLFRRCERIVQRVHEQPRHHLEDIDLPPAADVDQGLALARRPLRIVDRADQARVAVDIADDVAPKPWAAFSPFTATKSRPSRFRRPGRCSMTASRPARPTMSPQYNSRMKGSVRREDQAEM